MRMTHKFINQPHHSCFLPVASGPEIPKSLEDRPTNGEDVITGDPRIKRDGLSASLGAKEPSHKKIEPEAPILCRWHVRKIVNVRMLVEIV